MLTDPLALLLVFCASCDLLYLLDHTSAQCVSLPLLRKQPQLFPLLLTQTVAVPINATF